MTPSIVAVLILIAALSVCTFVARRVPHPGAAYPLAILAGGATFVALFLAVTFWLSFNLLSASGPQFGVD